MSGARVTHVIETQVRINTSFTYEMITFMVLSSLSSVSILFSSSSVTLHLNISSAILSNGKFNTNGQSTF